MKKNNRKQQNTREGAPKNLIRIINKPRQLLIGQCAPLKLASSICYVEISASGKISFRQ